MATVIEVLKALGALWWPAAAVILALLFRSEVRSVFDRIKKGKLPGGVELELESTSLEQTAAQIAPTAPDAVHKPIPPKPDAEEAVLPGTEPFPALLAAPALVESSPRMALIELSIQLERTARRIIATAGLLNDFPGRSLPQVVRGLERLGADASMIDALRKFQHFRNAIVHGGDVSDSQVARAVEAGLTILQAMRELPVEWHRVKFTNVPVFADEKCTERREGVMAVVLHRPTHAKGQVAYPTTLSHFTPEALVSWEWNLSRVLGESWYRDPDTAEILYGWTSSAEFVGRPLEAL